MMHINDLIKQYGSQQKLADAMGVHRPQVSRWVKLDAHIDEDGGVYIKTRSVKPVYEICGDEPNEWRDIAAKALAVLQANGIPLIGDYPERCLREIEAKAGWAGFIEGVRQMSDNEIGMLGHDAESCANHYAAKVLKGGDL